MTTRSGARCSAYCAFLKHSQTRRNLKLLTNAHVEQILIDETRRAYGVRFARHGKKNTVLATREVILSAGTIASPQILMLSGIGPKEHLDNLSVSLYFIICGYELLFYY